MTIESEVGKSATYTGDSSTTSFSFSPIVIQDADQLEVWRNTSGTYVLLTRGTGTTNYSVSVSEFPGTGTITYPADTVNGTKLASTQTLVIKRKADLVQEMDLENQGGYFPENQEDAFDLARIVDIQQQEEIDRCIKIPVDDETDAEDLWLPSADDRASKFLKFDENGLPTAVTAIDAGAVTISSFAETLLDDTSAQAFINTLTPLGQMTITDTDAGTGADPTLFLDRNSASPADDDDMGRVVFSGKNDAAETTLYARIQASIADASDGTEDGRLSLQVLVAGSSQEVLRIGQGQTVTIKSSDAGASVGPSLILDRDSASPADADVGADLRWRGENDAGTDTDYARVGVVFHDVSDGDEFGYLTFNQLQNGSEATNLCPGIRFASVATTSGTAVDFEDIPSIARDITVTFNGVSTDGTEELIVQLGVSGTPTTTGYISNVSKITGSTASEVPFTSGFAVVSAGAAADSYSGVLRMVYMGSNIWVYNSTIAVVAAGVSTATEHGAGVITLGGTLNMIRVTTTGTPDDFDAGSVGCLVQ